MIWFDAALDHPADDRLLQRCVAAMLGLPSERVDVVHSVGEIGDAPATCVVEVRADARYSQLVTFYLAEALPRPEVSEAAVRLARTLDTSLLLVDDETANPYSFVRVASSGRRSVVLVDPDELDKNDRYVVREPRHGDGGTSA
ncbi:hypothetical protein JR065_10320 [Xanthomonas sp. AmX2]|uniref:hypothetical protein n=1 Tax=Xanthomonas sp. TaxID=29446 RepID=UPI00197E6618|nr:hypothetical protein [Xanthomonas sp.]MBN6150736.1 hypothetical protein [Xanthomonas sp.]